MLKYLLLECMPKENIDEALQAARKNRRADAGGVQGAYLAGHGGSASDISLDRPADCYR
jgi:hypothetical protein